MSAIYLIYNDGKLLELVYQFTDLNKNTTIILYLYIMNSSHSEDTSRTSYLQEVILFKEQQFQYACDQITILNREITILQKRYKQMTSENQRSFKYNIRLKLATLEGVRCVFHRYAEQKALLLDQLNVELYQLLPSITQEELAI